MQKLKEAVRAAMPYIKSQSFMAAVLFLFTGLCVVHTAASTTAVVIRDDHKMTLSYTFKDDMNGILNQSGIFTMATDDVEFSGLEGGYAEINIARAFPVTLKADGMVHTVMMTDGTVNDVFDKLDLEFDSDDIIDPLPDKLLQANDMIELNRVDYITRTVTEQIPHETITRSNSLIRSGRTKQLTAGKDGQKVTTYLERTVDGVVEEAEILGQDIVSEPVTEQILVGENVAVSPLDFGVETDAYGRPLRYLKKLSNQDATGYYAGRGAWGASGLTLSAGYVAVNPNEIPYGTKMYIASPDGSFIYGYAIAADTGLALMDGRIDIDLYYDTFTESCLNGRRNVDIYILG